MKEAATRTLLQNTVGPALKATVSNPSEIAARAGPLSDALKTCYCKEELKEVELRRVWVQAAPHAEQAFEKFMELLNQVLIISKECSKLRTEQTNMVIQEICKDPNASFSEKQDRIMAQIRQQDQHNEQIVDKVVDAGKFITSAAVVGGGVTVLAKEGRKIATVCAKTSAVKAFSPAGAIKAACNGIKGIVKAVKK